MKIVLLYIIYKVYNILLKYCLVNFIKNNII
uniref:Uncharacterized protein n=1 Tax=viral metagenome TaxID=1070528 RepID=A0A6C0BDU2_9ZZZZ